MPKRQFRSTQSFAKTLTKRLTSGKDVLTLARHIHLQLVENTPRDNGFARANWFFNKNSQSTRVEPQSTDVNKSANTLPKFLRLKTDLYLFNNLPYILRLENGWSMQKPNGFLKSSIFKARKNFIAGVKRKEKKKKR